jgi:hypothetical protein
MYNICITYCIYYMCYSRMEQNNVHACQYIYIYTHTHTCIYVGINGSMCVPVCRYNILIYVCTYILTYNNICIYIYSCSMCNNVVYIYITPVVLNKSVYAVIYLNKLSVIVTLLSRRLAFKVEPRNFRHTVAMHSCAFVCACQATGQKDC